MILFARRDAPRSPTTDCTKSAVKHQCTWNAEFGSIVTLRYAEISFSHPDMVWGVTIEAGDPLINSPQHQASVQLSRNFDVGSMPAQVGGGFQYTDERLGFTAFDFTLPGYNTARFFAQIEPTERMAIRLDVDNVFDEVYYTNSYADVWVEPGAPLYYRVTESYSF